MTDEELKRVADLVYGPFEPYAAHCLRIRNKAGKIVPLYLTPTQAIIHERLEQQKREKGWVRAIILKGRQSHCSTYVAARFYRRASTYDGVNVYILSHEQSASDNLFDMVDRYQRHNPFAPSVGVSNVKELVFDKLDSSYAVATAGKKASGRGRAVSLFHGSEVAFWPNAADHFASSVQAVPLLPDTEIILESTANGPGGEFYERWQDAEAGRGDYIPIFVPWFANPEYAREPEPGFVLDSGAPDGDMSEAEYADLYGLSHAQMMWRRSKIAELRSEALFRQEYPASPAEAWQTIDGEPFIKPIHVLRARKRTTEGTGPLILGVDPASNGGDRFSVAARRGAAVLWVEFRNKLDAQEGIAWVRSLIDEHDPARVNIDAGNIGAAIISGLKSIGPKYAEVVRGVNFGAPSEAKIAKPNVPGPANRRAEMYMRYRDWLTSEEGASLPDMDALQSDTTAPRLKPKLNNDFLLESKVDMRARGIRSPDLSDAVALTFAFNEFITKYTEATKVSGYVAPRQQKPKVIEHIGGPFSWMG